MQILPTGLKTERKRTGFIGLQLAIHQVATDLVVVEHDPPRREILRMGHGRRAAAPAGSPPAPPPLPPDRIPAWVWESAGAQSGSAPGSAAHWLVGLRSAGAALNSGLLGRDVRRCRQPACQDFRRTSKDPPTHTRRTWNPHRKVHGTPAPVGRHKGNALGRGGVHRPVVRFPRHFPGMPEIRPGVPLLSVLEGVEHPHHILPVAGLKHLNDRYPMGCIVRDVEPASALLR